MVSVEFNSAKLFQSQMERKKIISVILFVYYSIFCGLFSDTFRIWVIYCQYHIVYHIM